MSKIESIFPKELDQFVNIFNKGFYPPEGVTNRKKVVYSSELCKPYFWALFVNFKDNEKLLNDCENTLNKWDRMFSKNFKCVKVPDEILKPLYEDLNTPEY